VKEKFKGRKGALENERGREGLGVEVEVEDVDGG